MNNNVSKYYKLEMGKFISNFETTAELSMFSATTAFKTPHVSLTKDSGGVHFFKRDYYHDYFTMVVTVGGDIKWSGTTSANTLSYSKDNGKTWNTADKNTIISVVEGDKVLWKGTPTPQSYYGIGRFSGDTNVRYSVEGNAMSLLFGDNFKSQTSLVGKSNALYDLFSYNKNVTSAENLSLPSTTLADNCYYGMFRYCTSLTTAPQLPATTLAYFCYGNMFQGCTSLTEAPELLATTLAQYCYGNMFQGCTSLTTAPKLSATTLASGCYFYMFSNCTSLTEAPELPATTLVGRCYNYMFSGCTSLTTSPELPATNLAESCYAYMFDGCTSLTTSPELRATTLANECYSGMFGNTNVIPDCSNIDFTSPTVVASGALKGLFTGTKITNSQLDAILKAHGINNYSLPVMTLAYGCYSNMFSGCTSLTTAPELPALNLANNCYSGMFQGCTSLTTAPQLSATTLANYCYSTMFSGCTSLTTAPELPATTLVNSCYFYMFSNCTSLSSIKCLATNISTSNCTSNWVNRVASNGTFTKAASMSSWGTGNNGIPSGWSVVDAS